MVTNDSYYLLLVRALLTIISIFIVCEIKKKTKKGKCQISRYLVLFISIYLSPVTVILQTVHSADVFIDYRYHWYPGTTRGAKRPRLTRHGAVRCRVQMVNRNFNTSVHDVLAARLYVYRSFWRRYYPPSHSLCLIQSKRSTAESKTNAFLNEAYHPLRATSCASFTIASCFDWGGLIFYFVDKYVKILSGKGGTKILISPIDKTTSSRLLPYLSDCISTEQTEKP